MNSRSVVLGGPHERVFTSGGGDWSPREVAVQPPAARPRQAMVQSFKIHVAVYASVNFPLIAIWAATGGGYFWPIWPILGWGIAVACHAAPLLARIGTRPPGAATQMHAGSQQAPDGTTSVDE